MKYLIALLFLVAGLNSYAQKIETKNMVLNLEKAVIDGSFNIEAMPFRNTDKK